MWAVKACLGFTALQLLQKTLNVNTTSMEQLRSILFNDIQAVRINDTFRSRRWRPICWKRTSES